MDFSCSIDKTRITKQKLWEGNYWECLRGLSCFMCDKRQTCFVHSADQLDSQRNGKKEGNVLTGKGVIKDMIRHQYSASPTLQVPQVCDSVRTLHLSLALMAEKCSKSPPQTLRVPNLTDHVTVQSTPSSLNVFSGCDFTFQPTESVSKAQEICKWFLFADEKSAFLNKV